MRAEQLKRGLDQCRFELLRLHLNDGDHVDMRHPDKAVVSRSLVAIAVGDITGVADHVVHYDLFHVARAERCPPMPSRDAAFTHIYAEDAGYEDVANRLGIEPGRRDRGPRVSSRGLKPAAQR